MYSLSLSDQANSLDPLTDWIERLTRSVRQSLFPDASFRTVFEEATEGIMVHEPDTGEMVAVNQRACELFGYNRPEVKRMTVEDLIADEPPYDSERAVQVTDKVLREGPQTLEWKYERDDGTSFWGEVKLKAIQFRSDRRILALVNDITERKRYEQALQEAKQTAKRANDFKSAVLTNVSHAVRTPLTSILGYAEVLEDVANGEARRFATRIRESSHRLKETYDGLLELAKLDASLRELTGERVDVAAVVGVVVRAYRAEAEEQDIALVYDPPDTPCVGVFDRSALVRIVEELIENALAFTGPEGRVDVSVAKAQPDVQVRVTDTGPGLSPDARPRVFEAFVQEQTADPPELQGAGIGLTIVRGLVDLLGGTVDIETEVGNGTTVTVQLPINK